MNEHAVVLAAASDSDWADRLERLLAAFGIPCSRTSVAAFWHSSAAADGRAPVRLLGSAETFLEMLDSLEGNPTAGHRWRQHVHSAFVAAGANPGSFERLVKRIAGHSCASLVPINSETEWCVSDELPEFCKAMSGVRVRAATSGNQAALVFNGPVPKAATLISDRTGAAFVRLLHRSVPLFLSIGDVVDVGAPLSGKTFDVRTSFLVAVPPVLYLKWAFADTCWQGPETAACVVIDDPPLRPRYGFVDFEHLLGMMERANFSTSIAFIPWNCNRSARTTVRLFRHNPRRFSLSVHGCDHTHHEFGIDHPGRLAWKSREAMERMARHDSRTGLSHDPVMVFPHGVFSETSMAGLKRSRFIGVVNSEVISADVRPRTIKISDYWDTAVMAYGDFPIFTRRYLWQGIENFAFDVLLGKPCIVCLHHNDCHDNCRHIIEFIERLNNLNAQLVWGTLGDVVRRSFRQRETSPGFVHVEMYGSEIRIHNTSPQKRVFHISKRECAATTIREVRAGARLVPWTATAAHVIFDVELQPAESQTITVIFHEPTESGFTGEGVPYRMKAMVRRYLTEVRDNYVMRKSFSQ